MLTGTRAIVAIIYIWIRRKTDSKPMMDQRRMWRTQGIVGLSEEQVLSTGICGGIATLRMQMKRNMQRKPVMYQSRMSRTEGIILESMKIGQYISDL
jgi:hypothetical protein